jgi:hypothetical protein
VRHAVPWLPYRYVDPDGSTAARDVEVGVEAVSRRSRPA